MPTQSNALALSRPLLRALIVLNLLYAAGIALMFVASLVAADTIFDALGVQQGNHRPQLVMGMRAIMLLGIAAAGVVDRMLRQLLAIVDSVRAGDAFILPNAQRLNAIAWSVLAIELMRLAVLAISEVASLPGRMTGLSPTPWLAVLLLFVLSGVFAHGARLRSDLEGTI